MIKTIDSKIELENTLALAREFISTNTSEDYCESWLNIMFYRDVFSNKYKDMHTLISVVNGIDVQGFIVGSKYIPKVFEIRQHYIGEDYRRKGLAKKLKSELTNYAGTRGYWLMISDVSKDNLPSIKLNHSLDWIPKDLDDDTLRFFKDLRKF